MMRMRAAFIVAVQLLALGLAQGARADDAILSDRRLPPNVLAYVSLRNIPELKTQWNKTLLGQLGKEEALADFLGDLGEQIKDASGKIEAEIGLSLTDLLAIPQGEVAVAIVQPPGKKIAAVLLLNFGDRKDSVEKLLEKAMAALEKHGVQRTEEEFDDTRIIIHHQKKDEGDAAGSAKKGAAKNPFDTLAYFIKGSFLAIGSSADALKAVITRWDGKHEQTFAENDVFRYLSERTRDENQNVAPLFTWFIDPIGLVKAIATTVQPGSPQVAMGLAFLPTLGLDKLKGIGGSGDFARGEYDSVSRTLVCIDHPATGVLNVFQFPAAALAPPKWVSSQVASYNALNWDSEKAYAAIETLVDTFQGAGSFSALIDQVAKNPQVGNIHIKNDVIDLLTGRIQVVGDFADPDKPDSERFLFALNVKNAAAFRTTLGKIANIPGFPGKAREFQGETLYEIATGSRNEEGDEANKKPAAVGIAVTENCLMIATDVTLLEDVMRGNKNQETLADSPLYKKIADKFPAQTSAIGFQKQDVQIRSLYEMLRSGKAGDLFGEDLKLDFAKLPPFDVVKKYLPPSGSYMVPDGRGLLFVSYSLRDEKD